MLLSKDRRSRKRCNGLCAAGHQPRQLGLEQLEDRMLLAVDAPAGLVSWWTADDTAADLMTRNDAALVSGATYAPGQVGQAFSFDGVDDRVQLPDSDSLKLTESLSIEGWVSVRSYPTFSGVILFRGDDRGGLDPYQVYISAGGNVRFLVSSLTGSASVKAPVPVPLNQFVHFAGTLDDTTGVMRLYVNGALAAERVTDVRPFRELDANSNPGIGIGNHGGYPITPHNFPLNGLIDELSVYNRALTSEEVQGIYNSGSEGKINVARLPGDANLDGKVDAADLNVLAQNWQRSDGVDWEGGDFTGDGRVDAADLNVLAQNWLAGIDDDIAIAISDATISEGGSLDVFVPQASGGLQRTAGMAYGPDGSLYVVSQDPDHSVLRFDGETGAFIDEFVASGSVGEPYGIVFGPDDNLYVGTGSAATNKVLRYDGSTGAFIDEFITAGSAGLFNRRPLLFGPDGNSDGTEDLYIGSNVADAIYRYDGVTGAPLPGPLGSTDTAEFVPPGSGGVDNPFDMTFGPDGRLYVTSMNTDQILRYDETTGAFLGTFVTGGSGGLDGPRGIAFGPDGYLYVSSSVTDQVLRYEGGTGVFVDIIASGASGLDFPRALLFDPAGNLLIGSSSPCCSGNGEVLRYSEGLAVNLSSPSGQTITVDYATADGTALAGSDYTAASGTLTFTPGETIKRILLVATDDVEVEADETLTVTLSNVTGDATITDSTATATISDDDSLRQITIDDVTVTEGDDSPHYRGAFVEGAYFNPLTFGPDGNLYTRWVLARAITQSGVTMEQPVHS